jgi:hypothetical protein
LHPPSSRTTAATVILLLAAVGLGGLLARPAAADDTGTVQPAANHFGAGRHDYGYTLNPGGTLEDGIVVVNHGGTPLDLDLAVEDPR